MSQCAVKLKPARARSNELLLVKSVWIGTSFQIFTMRWEKKLKIVVKQFIRIY